MYNPVNSADLSSFLNEKLFLRFGKNHDFWRVLEINENDNTLLIISAKCTTKKSFDKPYSICTWENSQIRKWLNNEFYDSYFSNEEKMLICETELIEKDDIKERNTVDKVFLLDSDEARCLFTDDNDRDCSISWWLRPSRRVFLEGNLPIVCCDCNFFELPGRIGVLSEAMFNKTFASGLSLYANASSLTSNISNEIGVRPVVRIKYDSKYPYEFQTLNEIQSTDCLIIQNKVVVETSLALEKMQIPEGIEEIASYCFQGERALKQITLPSSLKRIGIGAFENSGITSILLPDGINKIERECFSSSRLKSIKLPCEIEEICDNAFSSSLLETIDFPDTLNYIGNAAFSLTKISKVKITNPSIKLSANAFSYCSKLKEVILPKELEYIPESCFDNCNMLKYNLPETVKHIGVQSFCHVNEVTMKDGFLPEWNISNPVFSVNKLPFMDSKIRIMGENEEFGLIFINYDYDEPESTRDRYWSYIKENNRYFDFNSYDALFDVVKKEPSKIIIATYRYLYPYKLPDETKKRFEKWLKKQATKVGRYWIDNKNSEIFELLMEKDIFNAKNLNTLKIYATDTGATEIANILQSVTNENENNPAVITGPSKYEIWLNDYIESRKILTASNDSFIIEDGILKKYIGTSGVAIIPKYVKSIGEKAFYNNRIIKEIILMDGVTEINQMAFSNCISLETIIIPDSVQKIYSRYDFADQIFENCPSLKLLILPSIFAKNISDDIHKAFDTDSRFYRGNNLKMLVLPNAMYNNFELYSDKEVISTCKKASAIGFMLAENLYINNADYDNYRKYAISQRKKLLPTIYELDLVEALEFYDKEKKITPKTINEYTEIIPKSAIKCWQYLKNWMDKNQKAIIDNLDALPKDDEVLELTGEDSLQKIEKKLLDYCGLKIKDLPSVARKDGNEASKYLLAVLLYKNIPEVTFWVKDCYEWSSDGRKKKNPVILTPGKTAKKILEVLDEESLQSSFIELANILTKFSKYTKKFEILGAISLYANEETMKKVLQIADKYNISEEYLINYWWLSSTKIAILHADKKKYIYQYAYMRGYNEDEFREIYLYDCGLDENGCIELDVGERKIIARLQNNYKFALSDSTGKQLKSFPRTSEDMEKYRVAKATYEDTKKTLNSIYKNLKKNRLKDYLTGKTIPGEKWLNDYMNEPVHKLFASTLVWAQGKKTFTVKGTSFVCADGSQYTFETDKKVVVAHVMEMELNEIDNWRHYFTKNMIRQPFEQIWELIINFDYIKPDRYQSVKINKKILSGKSAHGIYFYYSDNYWVMDSASISFMNKELELELSEAQIDEDYVVLGELKINKQGRLANHVIYLLDKWTIFGRIAKNDISIMEYMDQYCASQILEFINVATKNNAEELTAALLDYKHKKYPDLDTFSDFLLEDL